MEGGTIDMLMIQRKRLGYWKDMVMKRRKRRRKYGGLGLRHECVKLISAPEGGN